MRDRDELNDAIKATLASGAGKRVLFWVLEQCAMYESPFAGANTNATNFILGRQDVGRRVLDQLNEIDPRIYPQLLMDIADMKAMAEAAQKTKEEGNDDDQDA